MVIVEYRGRLGNKMFEYALGRIIAEEKGYKLFANPLPFRATTENVEGAIYEDPQQIWAAQYCNLNEVLRDPSNRAIILRGYFQQSRVYLPFMDRIRKWFEFSCDAPDAISDVDASDLLIYIRLGDYVTLNLALNYQFYETAIHMADPRRVFIVTEEPNHPFLENFKRYSPRIFGGKNILSDLSAARFFQKVVISCSTFSWWAAMLSNASEIYFPIGDRGYWSGCKSALKEKDQDLRVDAGRFIYLYNAPTLRSGRRSPGCVELSDIKPSLMPFHGQSKAFWFE